MTEHGRAMHTDRNANATATEPMITDRERLESLQYHNRLKQPWQQADVLAVQLEWLIGLAVEALDARCEARLPQVRIADAETSFPCYVDTECVLDTDDVRS